MTKMPSLRSADKWATMRPMRARAVLLCAATAIGCHAPGGGALPDMAGGGASCFDGRIDGDETDVDCGGSCQRCSDGMRCYRADDCASAACVNNRCATNVRF